MKSTDQTLPSAAAAESSPPASFRWLRKLDRIFVFSVIVPTIAAALYFGLIASDVYISESRFVVRSPQRQSMSELGSLLAGSGFARSQDDAYSVLDYVQSRDALLELDGKLKLRSHFASSDVDFASRFPGLFGINDGFESFHRYFSDHIEIIYDSTSSVTTLEVRAFTAEKARDINEQLLTMGERLLNNLNARSRQDLIEAARQEVQVAEDKAKTAALAFSAYRSNRTVFNPDQESALALEGVVRLQEQLRVTETQLAQVKLVSPNNPQISTLAAQAERLRKSIEAETSKVLGARTSLSAKAPEYERLLLDKTFADQRLTGALATLDLARSEAIRKQLYLERLIQPNLPDHALEPQRIRSIFMVLVLGIVTWGVVSLVVSSVREHAE